MHMYITVEQRLKAKTEQMVDVNMNKLSLRLFAGSLMKFIVYATAAQ